MDVAFGEACKAAASEEAPIGAALFAPDGSLLAAAHNQPIARHDPTAHAEILCLREAAEKMDNYRLTGCIMAVTLEPCLMCTGALIHARVGGVVFATRDERAGALVTHLNGASLPFSNHHMWTIEGVLADECRGLLKRFFLKRRK